MLSLRNKYLEVEMPLSDSVRNLLEGMKELMRPASPKGLTRKWEMKTLYEEGGQFAEEFHVVSFIYDSNYPKIYIPSFEGYNRYTEYSSQYLEIEFDKNRNEIKFVGTNHKSKRKYKLVLFFKDAVEDDSMN